MIISKRRNTTADVMRYCHLLSDVTSVSYAVNFMYHNTTSDTIRKHNPLHIVQLVANIDLLFDTMRIV